jgi:hypothetical protein
MIESGPIRSLLNVDLTVAQLLGRTAPGDDLLELALREKCDVAASGDQKRSYGVLGARHRLSLKRIQRCQPELPFFVAAAAITIARLSGDIAKLRIVPFPGAAIV